MGTQSQAIANGATEAWEEAGWLVCQLSVEVPVHTFTVRDLLQLEVGLIVETQWKSEEDLPLSANHRQIAWVECEVAGDCLAIRLAELL